MSLLPAITEISDTYPNPSNATARTGFSRLWTAINEFFQKSELDLASASTLDIGAQTTTKLRITGTTGITSFGTTYRGPIQLRFSGIVTISYNATTLITPGGVSLTTTAGDLLMAWPKATSGTPDGWVVCRVARGDGNGSFVNVSASGTLGVTGATSITSLTASGAITPSQTAGIVGTTTNNNANAGSVGEVIESTVAVGSAVSLVANTPKTITSISLTAGDWVVEGLVNVNFAASTNVVSLFGAASLTTNAFDSFQFSHRCTGFVPGAVDMGYAIPERRVSLTGTTTVYLVGAAGFSVSTAAGWGFIRARRVR